MRTAFVKILTILGLVLATVSPVAALQKRDVESLDAMPDLRDVDMWLLWWCQDENN